MKKVQLLFVLSCCFFNTYAQSEVERWKSRAQNVEIIRDHYGVPHIYGRSDADAVFGLLYAQCEDDFNRVEMNYIEKLGRLSEINGESDMYKDLYIKMIIDSADAIKDYKKSPQWLKELLIAFADGINYYIHTHPHVKPSLLHRFEPWYQLLWTDGSIGAIKTADVSPNDLKALYTGNYISSSESNLNEYTGSNGFAISPSRSVTGNALFYINPHVTFYFRPEVHMNSAQGLNAYGAVTWGQFFIYQGFNEKCGWMHTSCNVDVADVYKEHTRKRGSNYYYMLDGKEKAFNKKDIIIKYKSENSVLSKTFPVYSNHRGPVMAIRDGKWATVRSFNRSLNGLLQCWSRLKAQNINDYKKVMDLRGNISNNTVYADADGHIAYWHGNYIPKRTKNTNWSKPIDGTTSKNDWQGVHTVNETVHTIDPATGFLQNCNSTPFTVAGAASPDKLKYPHYMAPDGENFRGINAVRVFGGDKKFDLESMIQAGYDRKLAAFEILIPPLIKAFEEYSYGGDNAYLHLEEPINILKAWDYNVSTESIATTLAIEWAEQLQSEISKVYIDEGEDDQVNRVKKYAKEAGHADLLKPLSITVAALFDRYGTWKMPWGNINRMQRLNSDIVQKPDDTKPSIAIPFASSGWGMLPAYISFRLNGSNNRYGVHGNSFICAVEFGKKIKAKSLLAGGNSGDPKSPHFWDQAQMYADGKFKDVLFYREDVEKNVEKRYRPGE